MPRSAIMSDAAHAGVSPAASSASTPIHGELAQVLQSQTFGKAPTLRALLEYLATPRAESVNEYAIATEVLGRRADFDPKTDATVRVQISRLRAKLKQFYDGEGRGRPLRLELPLGEHRVILVAMPAPEAAPEPRLVSAPAPPPLSAPAPASRWRRWFGLAAALAAGLVMAGGVSFVARARSTAASASVRSAPRFWTAFFEGGAPARLIFPTPVFYQWHGRNLRVRDFAINEYGDYGKSADLHGFVERYGPPTLSQSYSVASDTTAAIRLTQYLTRLGFPLVAGATGDLPLQAFGDDHIIFLGIPATTSHIHESLRHTSFWMDPATTTVYNRTPRTGERAAYGSSAIGERRRRDFGVVALLPSRTGRGKLLVIASGNTAALSAFLIATSSLAALDRHWQRQGRPPFFEVLVQADVEGDTLLQAEPLALRPVSPRAIP